MCVCTCMYESTYMTPASGKLQITMIDLFFLLYLHVSLITDKPCTPRKFCFCLLYIFLHTGQRYCTTCQVSVVLRITTTTVPPLQSQLEFPLQITAATTAAPAAAPTATYFEVLDCCCSCSLLSSSSSSSSSSSLLLLPPLLVFFLNNSFFFFSC